MMFLVIICVLSLAWLQLSFLAGVGKTNRGEMVNQWRLGISGASSGYRLYQDPLQIPRCGIPVSVGRSRMRLLAVGAGLSLLQIHEGLYFRVPAWKSRGQHIIIEGHAIGEYSCVPIKIINTYTNPNSYLYRNEGM
jgi:hypothetical protein